MNFMLSLFGYGAPAPQPEPEPARFFNEKVHSFGVWDDDAWMVIRIWSKGIDRPKELIVPMTRKNYNRIYNNEMPVLNELNVLKLGRTEYMSPEFKQEIFDAIVQNKSSLCINGKKWKILGGGSPRLFDPIMNPPYYVSTFPFYDNFRELDRT